MHDFLAIEQCKFWDRIAIKIKDLTSKTEKDSKMRETDFEKDLNKKQKELLEFIKEIELGQWYSGDRIPNPRFPILAIINVKDFCKNCQSIPVTGEYDKDSILFVPFVADENDLLSLINWDRVLRWRYLMWNEADRKWLALINKKGDEIDYDNIKFDIDYGEEE